MSNETTPAIERAQNAGPHAYTQAMITPDIPHVWRHVATNVLAAALDVEEMAEVIFRSDYEAYRSMAWTEQDEITKDEYRLNARALRAAILGGES